MEDNAIIELYWQRDEAAISASQQAYGAYCLTIARRILAALEDAEECVGDTWLKAWHAMPPQRPAVLRLFFGRITRNLALDRYAAQRTAKRGGGETALVLEELENCISGKNTVEQATQDAELQACINRFLRSLPQRERHVFLCRYWELTPLKEIARRYGMKENAVKASLYRSRNKLRAALEQEEISL